MDGKLIYKQNFLFFVRLPPDPSSLSNNSEKIFAIVCRRKDPFRWNANCVKVLQKMREYLSKVQIQSRKNKYIWSFMLETGHFFHLLTPIDLFIIIIFAIRRGRRLFTYSVTDKSITLIYIRRFKKSYNFLI